MDYRERINRINSWQQTEEYAQQCNSFLYNVIRLISFAEQQVPEIDQIAEKLENQTVRTAAAKHSSLHRGFYCPSRIYDIVVGNVKRESLLKRLTARSKSYFLYGFDANDQLIWIKHFFNNCHINTEYLFRMDNNVFGLTIGRNGRLEIITEEVYAGDHLLCYRYMLVSQDNNCVDAIELTQEDYKYDCQGLLYCDWYTMIPTYALLQHKRVTFTRENGMLKQYWVEKTIGNSHEQVIKKSDTYEVLVERKA